MKPEIEELHILAELTILVHLVSLFTHLGHPSIDELFVFFFHLLYLQFGLIQFEIQSSIFILHVDEQLGFTT